MIGALDQVATKLDEAVQSGAFEEAYGRQATGFLAALPALYRLYRRVPYDFDIPLASRRRASSVALYISENQDFLDDSSVRVNTYRRNVQRAFLNAVDRRLDPEDTGPGNRGPWASDIRAVLRAELSQLDELAEGALERPADAMTRIHLRDVRSEIARITNPS